MGAWSYIYCDQIQNINTYIYILRILMIRDIQTYNKYIVTASIIFHYD